MSAHEEERLARIALGRTGDVGRFDLLELVRKHGAVTVREALLAARNHGEEQALVAAALDAADPERELEFGAQIGARFVIPGDDEWATQLDDLAGIATFRTRGGVPMGLWVRGPLRLDSLSDAVAVVGTREASVYGAEVAANIAAQCAVDGRTIVSGGAIGVDYAAHLGAVKAGGKTVAILAGGADVAYPKAHEPMLEHLARESAVISEAPFGAESRRVRFRTRNRLIAALSVGTVVVEAAARSGSLSTARWAQQMNRQVMAVPGPVTSEVSIGANQWIKDQRAQMVASGAEVLELIAEAGENLVAEPRGRETPRDRLSASEQAVLEAMPAHESITVDELAMDTLLGVATVEKSLETLATGGLVIGDLTGWHLPPLQAGRRRVG